MKIWQWLLQILITRTRRIMILFLGQLADMIAHCWHFRESYTGNREGRHKEVIQNSGILNNKTMDDKLMYVQLRLTKEPLT